MTIPCNQEDKIAQIHASQMRIERALSDFQLKTAVDIAKIDTTMAVDAKHRGKITLFWSILVSTISAVAAVIGLTRG